MFGLDPFIVLGMATAGSGAVGWLVGPFIGNAVFGWVHRGLKDEIAEVRSLTTLQTPASASFGTGLKAF